MPDYSKPLVQLVLFGQNEKKNTVYHFSFFCIMASNRENWNKDLFTYFNKLKTDPHMYLDARVDYDDFFTNQSGPSIFMSHFGDCWEFEGGSTKNGYTVYEFRGSDKQLKVCAVMHFMYFFNKDRNYPEWDSSFDFSHLCHPRYCINPMHISLESHQSNLKRRMCKRSRKCKCNQSPKCALVVSSNRA